MAEGNVGSGMYGAAKSAPHAMLRRVPRFTLDPADEHFLTSAPKRFVGTFDVPRPAADIWLDLVRDKSLDWCRVLSGARWTSPRPFGVGSTRDMPVGLGALVVHEKYFLWEEGRRKAFFVEAASLPLFKRFAEDYVVEETGAASCRFTWTIAAEPLPHTRPGAPVNALLAKSMFADTRRHFDAR